MRASAFDGSSANASCSAVLAARRLPSRSERLARRVSKRLCSTPLSAARSTEATSPRKSSHSFSFASQPSASSTSENSRPRADEPCSKSTALAMLPLSMCSATHVRRFAAESSPSRSAVSKLATANARSPAARVICARYNQSIEIVGLILQQLLDEHLRLGVLASFGQRVQQSAQRGSVVGLEHERLLERVRCSRVAARFLLEVAGRRVNMRRVAAELRESRQVHARIAHSARFEGRAWPATRARARDWAAHRARA